MVQVHVYDQDGNHHDSVNLPATKGEVLQALDVIHDPTGGAMAHFQIGKGEPVSITYHPDDVQEAMEGGALPGILSGLLSAIPVFGPILSGILGGSGIGKHGGLRKPESGRVPSAWQTYLKTHMRAEKKRHPLMSHGDLMRKLSKGYHGH